MIIVPEELDCSRSYIYLRELDKSNNKAKRASVVAKDAKENMINMSSTP